jgi:hypothetical protein
MDLPEIELKIFGPGQTRRKKPDSKIKGLNLNNIDDTIQTLRKKYR